MRVKNFIDKLGQKYRFWLLLTAGSIIFLQLFVVRSTLNWLIFVILFLWGVCLYWFKFEAKISVSVALALLALCAFLTMFGQEQIAERVAIAAFTFLLIGTVQISTEYFRTIKANDEDI